MSTASSKSTAESGGNGGVCENCAGNDCIDSGVDERKRSDDASDSRGAEVEKCQTTDDHGSDTVSDNVSPTGRGTASGDATGGVREVARTDGESDGDGQVGDSGVTYLRLGVDHVIEEDESAISIQCGRIRKIENLEKVADTLTSLELISNHISKIENIEMLTKLKNFHLYQNRIRHIENLQSLTNLVILDLSFNQIQEIRCLDTLVNLEELYLASNHIQQIEGLENLEKLRLLELGNNKIRKIEKIGHLKNLEELWMGKNKVTQLSLPELPKLRSLSLQSNRLIDWDDHSIFQNTPSLTDVFLSHNRLTDIPEDIQKLEHLKILDLSNNKIAKIAILALLQNLEDLWLNDNSIQNFEEVEELKALQNLSTIYLERNSIQLDLGPAYRSTVIRTLPRLSQLDAIPIPGVSSMISRKKRSRIG